MRAKHVIIKDYYDLPKRFYSFFDKKIHPSLLESSKAIHYRLKKLQYEAIKVPIDSNYTQVEQDIISFFSKDIKIIPQFFIGYFKKSDLSSFLENSSSIEVVFTPEDLEKKENELFELSYYENISFSLFVTKKDLRDELKLTFCEQIKNIHVYFPYKDEHVKKVSNKKIYSWLKKIKATPSFPNISPPFGSPLIDSRSGPDTKDEKFWPAKIDSTISSLPTFSIIIPSYNNGVYLRKTLYNLSLLQKDFSQYEVIVIEDGTKPSKCHQTEEDIKSLSSKMQIKYIYSPRKEIRKMGDGRYRAGKSRNLGVAHSRGKILCFLDSDIIIPHDYLDRVAIALEKYDVVQCRRFDLNRKTSLEINSYNEISWEKDILFQDSYWDNFNLKTLDWNQVRSGWKYTCTHSLSLSAETFKKNGWILPCFIFYGFEDTELGHRLWKRDFKFHLSKTKVYHLYHEKVRSEFLRNQNKREELLSKTAEVFFRNRPDPEIYEVLRSYL